MDIGIIGLGLIGGSLGLDFRALGHRVLGVSDVATTCTLALERGVVEQASCDLSLLSTVDIVFLCTPVGVIESVVEHLIPHLSEHAILTDVGSVKAPVVKAIEPLWPRFVGGHPMSGTEATGIEAARPHLFEKNPYVLTPTVNTPPDVLVSVRNLVRMLGGPIYECSPDIHDRAVAWISHLPNLASTGLIATCLTEANAQVLALAQTFASSGFRDTSRVGGGNPELTRMMAQHNRAAVLQVLYRYQETLSDFIALIEASDWEALQQRCEQTQQARPKFL